MEDPIGVFLGPWAGELNFWSVLLRIGLSFAFSAVIGLERSSKRHSAGLRTFVTLSLAATVTMLLDTYLGVSRGERGYFLSGAVMIGVAVISVRSLLVSSRSQIKGLTTAAALFACSAIGLTAGAGLYSVTLLSFGALLCCLNLFPAAEKYLKNRSNHFEIHLELKDSRYLQNFVSTIRRLGLKIDDIEKNDAYRGSGLSVYSIAFSISSRELKKYKSHEEIIEALRSLQYIGHIEEMLM